MKDWSSAPQVMRDANAFVNLMHVLLGLYIWELFVSRDFDWEIFSAKRRFRWPMIIYFLNRFLLLFALIGIAVALNVTTPIDCQSLYTFNQLTGMASVGLASINLSIRTMAVWMHNRWVVGLLSTLILGHWSLILQGALLTAVFIPGQGCIIINTNDTVLVVTFIYGMCFDFVVLLLNAWRLCNLPETLGTDAAAFGYTGWHKSKLGRLIFRDGLIYFVVAFLANLLATIFMLLHLNAIMDVIFNVPAAVASTIVACRVVQRLTMFTSEPVEVFMDNRSRPSRPPSAFRAASPFSHLASQCASGRTLATPSPGPGKSTFGLAMANFPQGSPSVCSESTTIKVVQDDLEAGSPHRP